MLQEEDAQHQVWEELKAVRNRGIGRLDEPKRPGLKEVLTPLLEEAATTVPGYSSNLTRVAKINLLLKHEVAHIQAPAYRDQLIASLGLRDDLDNTDPASLREKAAKIANEEPLNYGRTGGTEQATLWVLAGQIVADCFQREGAVDEDGARSSIAAQLKAYEYQPFIERERYGQDFQRLIDQQHRRIVLNGGRGNGKSRLALELVARQPRALEDGLFVNASSMTSLTKDLRAIAASRGKPDNDPFEEFVKFVSSADSPSYVIIDNLEDPALLEDLLSGDSRSIIVITANRKIPAYASSSLEVTPMEEREAIKLVANLLPAAKEEEHQRVAKALGSRPLAVVHACGYIINSATVTVDEFLADLKADAASTLQVPAAAEERTLTAIYDRILIQLEELYLRRDVLAKELLELVACVAPEEIPPNFVREAMGSAGNSPSRTKFQEAVLTLQTRFLVRMVGQHLAIHPLTQEIIRALLRKYGKEQALCLRLHLPIQQLLQHETHRNFVGPAAIDLIAHICKVVVGLQKVSAGVFREIDLGRTLAVIAKSGRQVRLKRDFLDSALDDATSFCIKALGSVFDDDEPEWVSFDDVRELVRVIIPTSYEGGQLPSEDYLEQMAALLGITNLEDVQQYENLKPSDLIEFCTAALAHGLCAVAIGILESQEDRVRNEYVEPVEYGDYQALKGEVLLVLTQWEGAEAALNEALRSYERAGNNLLGIRGTARVLKLLGDLVLMSGQSNTALAELTERVTDFALQKESDWERDVLAASYIHRFFARQRAAEYLRSYYHWYQHRLDFVRVEGISRDFLDIMRKVAEAFGAQDQTEREYLRGEYVREVHDFAYDRILVLGLLNPESLNEVVGQYGPQGGLAGDPLLQVRGELARFKVATLCGGGEVDTTVLARLSAQIEAVANCEAHYWFSECLAVMCILLVQSGSPNANLLLEEFRESCVEIGRQDRAAYVERAIDAWRAGDREQFKRDFAYLLTF